MPNTQYHNTMEPATVKVTQHEPQSITSTPTFYPSLFDALFKDEESWYSKWKTSELPWQLRLVGGPGSGKTSFAALAVQDLGNFVKAKPDSIVLSVFLSTITSGDNHRRIPLQTALLDEIGAQLQRHIDTKPRLVILPAKSLLATEKTPSIHVEAIQVEDEAPQPLPDKIKSRLSHFSHTYLVVDDIDAAWLHPDEYPKIEDILSKLDTLNVRILVTSRTHYRKNQPRGRCAVELTEEEEDPNELHCGHRDFCLDDDDREHVVWWQCVACTEEEDDPRMVNTVCVACWRRGYGCDKPVHASSLFSYEKKIAYIDMPNLSDVNRGGLMGLIDHHLQSEHGQFLCSSTSTEAPPPLNSHKPTYPPLSSIGNQLLPAIPASRLASYLRSIISKSEGNVLNALCRIEAFHYLGETGIESALGLEGSDRLPSHLVAVFDELVARHVEVPLTSPNSSSETRMRAAMALHAIRIVGTKEDRSTRFSNLKKDLLKADKVCGHGFGEVLGRLEEQGLGEEDVLGYVIGTTGGLLTAGRAFAKSGRDPTVNTFHTDFWLYVKEEYNSFLAERRCCR